MNNKKTSNIIKMLDNFISNVLKYISVKRKNKELKKQLIDRDKEIDDLRDAIGVITMELHNQKNINIRLAKERNNLQIEVNGLRECQKK